MPLEQFRAQHLGLVPVEEVKVTGFSTAPARGDMLQLRASGPELIAKMAELVSAAL
jgi:hypothetical protein